MPFVNDRFFNMKYLNCIVSFLFIGVQFSLAQREVNHFENSNSRTNRESVINVWYGLNQMIGHLGSAQDDFNLIGNINDFGSVEVLTCQLNGAHPDTLTIGRGHFGNLRRLAADGDFNADIPINRMKLGLNRINLYAYGPLGTFSTVTVLIDRQEGACELPFFINWNCISNPQNVGQYIDGKWSLAKNGLRTVRTGYDRIFLIGNRTWQDYEITVPFTINRVVSKTGPVSFANGIGLLMRFQGHIVNPPRFPASQPKWGYQPFGAIGWLRWEDGSANNPTKQFHRGDNNKIENFGTVRIVIGKTYWMKMCAETLPDDSLGRGVTKYSWKFWTDKEMEPSQWDWQVIQTSHDALRSGGVALLSHHVDVTFGDIAVIPKLKTVRSKGTQNSD